MHELYLLALALTNDKYVYKINTNLIVSDEVKQGLQELKLYGKAVWHNLPNILHDNYHTVCDYYNYFNNLAVTIADQEFAKYYNIAEQSQAKIIYLNRIEEAKKLIQSHYFNEAVKVLRGLTFTTNQEFEDSLAVMQNATIEGNIFQTGVKEIDDKLQGFQLSNVMTLAGDSGQMKTMFSLWLMYKILVHNQNFKGAYFEKEMATTDIGRRMIAMFIKVEMSQILGIHINLTGKEKDEAIKELNERIKDAMTSDTIYSDAYKRLTIVPQDAFDNATDMWSIIEGKNINIWALDYLTMFESPDANYNKFMEEQIKLFKKIVLETETFGIILAQLKQDALTDKPVKIPQIDHLEYGKKLRQLSAWVFANYYPYHYEHHDDPTLFFAVCLKNRNNSPQHLVFDVHKHISSFNSRIMPSQAERWLRNVAMSHKAMSAKKRKDNE